MFEVFYETKLKYCLLKGQLQQSQIFGPSYFDRALVIAYNQFLMKFFHVLKSCKLFWLVWNLFVSCILGCNICDTRLWTQNASSLHRSTSNTLVQTKEFFRKSLLYVYLYQCHFRWFVFGLRFLNSQNFANSHFFFSAWDKSCNL